MMRALRARRQRVRASDRPSFGGCVEHDRGCAVLRTGWLRTAKKADAEGDRADAQDESANVGEVDELVRSLGVGPSYREEIGEYVWLPGYRPRLQAGERYGVDVSSHQGEIDWHRVAGDGIEFAYIKATEGGDFVDEWFQRNWDGAVDAGLDLGAYHFFTLCRPGAEQAKNFLRTLPSDSDALPPAVDLELGGNCSDRPDRAWIERELVASRRLKTGPARQWSSMWVTTSKADTTSVTSSTVPSGIGGC